jgi:hypothetical protein
MVPLEQAGQLETAAILSFLTAALRFLALSGDFLRSPVLVKYRCGIAQLKSFWMDGRQTFANR